MGRLNLVWRIGALVRPPVTFGVRVMVLDVDHRVLLVRHTYASGWHFPGGAVDPGESAREAAERELREETGLTLERRPTFFGLYFNKSLAARDHVALFVADDLSPLAGDAPKADAFEIAEARLFPRDALPQDAARSVHRRLAELDGKRPGEIW